jgi:hypothetical protein
VCPVLVIVTNVLGHQPFQMPLIKHDGSGANDIAASITVAFGELRTNVERTE